METTEFTARLTELRDETFAPLLRKLLPTVAPERIIGVRTPALRALAKEWAGTPEADENCSVMACRQVCDYLENGNIVNSVNFPNVSFARADGDRIAIMHSNSVGMLGVVTDTVASQGLNIENLVNKSRGDIAYTLLDFNEEVPEDLIDKLKALNGVIRVRLIR